VATMNQHQNNPDHLEPTNKTINFQIFFPQKSTKYVKRYLLISTLATVAAFSEGFYITVNTGITDMALNYFAFSFWNIYFLICVYSYYDRYKERASFDGSDGFEAEAMGV
jgi:hypothetical protein